MKYFCEHCNYQAKQKSHYDKHLKTNKHIQSCNSEHFDAESEHSEKKREHKVNILQPKSVTHPCKYCHKTFTTKTSMYRHIRYACKKSDDEDMKELARLLNEQNNTANQKTTEQIDQILKQNETMKRQIQRLTRKLKIQNIGTQNNMTNNINNINNYNIKLLNFMDTDYSHLTTRDYAKCITDCNHCVKTMIEKVHFNEEKPENMNVYIASMKDKYIMVYKDDHWMIQNRKKIIDRMYTDNECEIDMWLQDHAEKFPQLVDRYRRYQHNKKSQDIEEEVKELIILDLYNRRNMVKNNSKSIATELPEDSENTVILE